MTVIAKQLKKARQTAGLNSSSYSSNIYMHLPK